MNLFLRVAVVVGAVLLAGTAHATVYASAPDPAGMRLLLDCEQPVQECRVGSQVKGATARHTARMRLDPSSKYVDFLRQAAKDFNGEGSVPDPAVLGRIDWSECRDDRESSGLAAVCPVGNWDSGTLVVFLRGLCDRCRFAPVVVTAAGAPASLEAPAKPTATAPTALATGEAMTAGGRLRTDGVYASQEFTTAEGSRYRSYLRFFDGGEALHVNSMASPEQVCRRYVQGLGIAESPGLAKGRVEQSGAGIAVSVASTRLTTRFGGRLDRDALRLEMIIQAGGRVPVEYAFVECPGAASR